MRPKLIDLKFDDFSKLLEIIVKLSNVKDSFMITMQMEYFIVGLNMGERLLLNSIIDGYLRTKIVDEYDFDEFMKSSRNEIIEIDETGKTPPEKIDFYELKIKTIVSTFDIKIRKKTAPSREEKQLIDAWGLKVFENIHLTKDHCEQEDFLITKYRSELVGRKVFDEYSSKIEKIFGCIEPWKYIVNYCKSKRIKETFAVFLKITYTIIDCIVNSPQVPECEDYVNRFIEIIKDEEEENE